jgi:hypothetical protein
MDKVTIADCTFLQYSKSCSIGGDNVGVGPTHFEWELADPQNARFVTDSFLKDAKGTGQVALLLESFFLHPENYLMAMEKPFDYVLTSNQYFVENHTNWLWYPHGGSWINFEKWGLHEKIKNISLILSEKKSMRGHALRHGVFERYKGLVNDVFGCYTNRVSKYEGIARYRYSVVIEPERCPGLFSEHLIDCLSVGTIPIYWGCPNVGEYFDDMGIIQVANLDEIQDALDVVNRYPLNCQTIETEEAIINNIAFAEEYRIAEDWIYREYPFLFRSQNAHT